MPSPLGLRSRVRTAAKIADALVRSVADAPDPVEPVAVHGAAEALRWPIRVLVWNIQFAAGREPHFFYDGGRDVHVPPHLSAPTLDRVADVIRAAEADLVLLQEVDRGSDRTQRVDQHLELLRRVAYPVHASTWYFRNRYVPHPPHAHLGRVDTHLSVFSRFHVSAARRYRLAEMREPWLRRQFNLRRAVLELDLPQVAGPDVRVLDTHLSAFSMGDGSLPVQVGQVLTRLVQAGRDGHPAICGGDWNALPPGDDPERLGADAALYREDGWPLAPLFAGYTSAVTPEQHADEPERWRTWLPRGTDAPDRAIDHLFATRDLEVLDSAVLRGDPGASDHLPLLVELAPR